MKNPIGVYPSGKRVTLAAYLADDSVFQADVGCPRCGAKLQLIGRDSQHPAFPRWEHMPFEKKFCDMRSGDLWLPSSKSDD